MLRSAPRLYNPTSRLGRDTSLGCVFLDYFVIISNFDIHMFFNSTLLDLFWRTEPQQKTVIRKKTIM